MRNRFYLLLMLASGILTLVYTVFAVYREVTPEWVSHQAEYKKVLLERVGKINDESLKTRTRSLSPEIQQIYLPGLKRVDRCTSCHIGVNNPLMAGAALPLAPHSGDYLKHHSSEKYGCTICHFGQGRAINQKEAHGTGHDTHWSYPIIPLKFIQSSCSQCHDNRTLASSGGERVLQGEKLFNERGCKGCHKLDGKGGVLGKQLDGVGSQPIAYFPMTHVRGERTVFSWLKEHFDDPRNIVPGSEMKADLTDAESDFLTTYVLSLRSEEIPRKFRRFIGGEIDISPAMQAPSGEALYRMYCVACHVSGKDSTYDEVFKRTVPAIRNPYFIRTVDPAYLKTIIKEGRAGTPMTAWKLAAAGLKEKEIDRIIEYLMKDKPRDRPKPFGFSQFKGDISHGEELFNIRCVSCHGERGHGGVGLNLRNPVVQKGADPEFLAITIRDGRKGTHMVAFGSGGIGLSDQDIADVVTYLRTLANKK